MEQTIEQILNNVENGKLDARLLHCFVLGFEWAVITDGDISSAHKDHPGKLPAGGRLIHLETNLRKER